MTKKICCLLAALLVTFAASFASLAKTSRPKVVTVALKMVATGHLFVPVVIAGSKYNLMLDTGCNATDFDWEASKSIKFANLKYGKNVHAVGLGANKQRAEPVIIPKFKVGNGTFRNMLVYKTDLTNSNNAFKELGIEQFVGVIGADFLIKNKAIIDYEKKTLTLKQADQ